MSSVACWIFDLQLVTAFEGDYTQQKEKFLQWVAFFSERTVSFLVIGWDLSTDFRLLWAVLFFQEGTNQNMALGIYVFCSFISGRPEGTSWRHRQYSVTIIRSSRRLDGGGGLLRTVASGLNRRSVWHWGSLATITTSSTTKTYSITSTITGIASCCSWLLQQHGEDLSGLLAQLPSHLLVHPLSGTPSQSRRTHIKGEFAHCRLSVCICALQSSYTDSCRRRHVNRMEDDWNGKRRDESLLNRPMHVDLTGDTMRFVETQGWHGKCLYSSISNKFVDDASEIHDDILQQHILWLSVSCCQL